MIGKTLGHYRIDSKLGEGGMGVVYRATDPRLGRPVAIKVLRPDTAGDAGRRKRFEQEARAASALNHPNIVTIHEIDTAGIDGEAVDFIVMEFVEGKALDQIIGPRGRPLRVSEAVKYGAQVADALARAHASGIIHRDLKPGNLMVTPEGRVKVLDFGLAKLTEPDSDELAETRTLEGTSPRTEEGTIIGTVAYMSPEQAEGKKLDARSDIFSFGSVLYEMVTGRRAFHGETKLSVLSAILHQDPKPASEAGAGVPRELEKVIARCLRKDPERRFQHMGDVKIALEEAREESEAAPAPRTKIPSTALWTLLLIAGLAALAIWRWWPTRERAGGAQFVLTQLTADAGLTTDPAISPDGKLVAYASDRGADGGLDIWVQQVSGGQAIRLTRHPADDHEPAFAPDGTRIAFRSEREGGGIYSVSTLGGEEKLIARQGHRPRFSPDGTQIAYWVGNVGGDPSVPGTSKIYVVPAAGGTAAQVQPEFAAARLPIWSADGKRLLFWGIQDSNRPSSEDWWVAAAAGGSPTETEAYDVLRRRGLTLPAGTYMFTPAEWTVAGERVLFAAQLGDSTNLWDLPVSPKNGLASGSPHRLTSGSGLEMQPSAALSGAIVFASLRTNADMWQLPLDGNRGKPSGPMKRVTDSLAPEHSPMLSAGGRHVVFYSKRSGTWEIRVRDLQAGTEVPLASVSRQGGLSNAITADGSKVAYMSEEKGKRNIYLVAATGGVAEKICDDCNTPYSFSSDASKLLYWVEGSNPARIGLLDLSSGQKSEIISRQNHAVYRARFSPDNRWIAFHARGRPGRSSIYVAPFRGTAPIPEHDWIRVTDDSSYDFAAAWSSDSNTIYFLSERHGFRCVWAQRFDPAAKGPVGEPFAVQDLHTATRSMSPLGTNALDVSAARDKLVFNLAEVGGNVWMAKPETQQ